MQGSGGTSTNLGGRNLKGSTQSSRPQTKKPPACMVEGFFASMPRPLLKTFHKSWQFTEEVSRSLDAAKLASALANGELTPIYVPEQAVQEDRTLIRMRMTFVRKQARAKDRYEVTILESRAISAEAA